MRKGRSLAAGNLPVELQQVRGTQVEHCRPAQLERPAFQKFRWINDTGVGQKIAVAAGMTSPIWPTLKVNGKIVILGL